MTPTHATIAALADSALATQPCKSLEPERDSAALARIVARSIDR
jgi:hypothetical protein